MECETKAHDDETAAFRTEHAARAFASVHTKEESCRYDMQTVFYIRGLEKERWLPLLKVGEIMRLQSSFDTVGIKKMFASFAKLKKL